MNQRPPLCQSGEHSGLLHGTVEVGEAGIEPAWWAHETPLEPPPVHSPVSRAGRSRTCLPPRIRRSPRRSASARRKRPVRDSNPSRLLDRQVATPAASQGGRVSGGSRTRPSDAAGRCLGCSATDTVSKGGRCRTLCAGFGVHTALPGAHPCCESCPGRTRTCSRLVNSEPLYH